MPFPNLAGDFETFFESTRIWLFGKEFKSLQYRHESMDSANRKEFSDYFSPPNPGDPLPMPPRRLERTLRPRYQPDGEDLVEVSQIFARIYSFSYEAHYYRLPRPLLFLVRGPGQSVSSKDDARACAFPSPEIQAAEHLQQQAGTASTKNETDAQKKAREKAQEKAARERRRNGYDRSDKFTATITGVEARDWSFSDDILVWGVDRKDLTVCLDVEIGNYQEVLLDSMIASERSSADDRGARSRGDIIGRGGAGSFRGDMIGPHQNKL